MGLRSWVEVRVRRQRARATAADAVVADVNAGTVGIEELMDDIIAMHDERYHPGYGCAENTHGQCLDRFGGERAAGLLGEHWRLA